MLQNLPPHNPHWEVTPQQVKTMLDNGQDVVLVDCRTDKELMLARMKATVHLPLQEISRRLNELRPYADRKVVVYCHHGRRSLQMTAMLRQAGFSDVTSMAGGIDRWSLEIDPSVPRY